MRRDSHRAIKCISSKKTARRAFYAPEYHPDGYLVFGCESAGLPAVVVLDGMEDRMFHLPMLGHACAVTEFGECSDGCDLSGYARNARRLAFGGPCVGQAVTGRPRVAGIEHLLMRSCDPSSAFDFGNDRGDVTDLSGVCDDAVKSRSDD